jgi:hypothetical protein
MADRAKKTKNPRRFQAGDSVELRGLLLDPKLNGTKGTLIAFDSDVGRWQVEVEDSGKSTEKRPRVLRVKPANLSGDHLLVQFHQGKTVRLSRSQWSRPDDPVRSMEHVYIALVRPRGPGHVVGGFKGEITALLDGQPPLLYRPPSVAVLDHDRPFVEWNPDLLFDEIRRRLTGFEVVAFKAEWDAPTEILFSQSVAVAVAEAHARPNLVQVAVRTYKNSHRFGLMQALSESNACVTAALLGRGHVVVDPTEAIVYRYDDMIKLPGSMTLQQAGRKVAEVVLTPPEELVCPVCLEYVVERSVFMPCPCKTIVHALCLESLFKDHCAACPVCRAPVDPSASLK